MRLSIALAVLLFSGAVYAQTAEEIGTEITVDLDNGERLIGFLTDVTEDTIVLEHWLFGSIEIARSRIVVPEPEAVPEPALEETELAAAQSPEAAQPAGAVTPTAAETTRFARPVDAPISRRFSRLPGPNRNDGVDFASPAGMTVRAAESGTVALVSKSLGGLGTIVLIRHDGGLLTVYGRVDDVTVTKGDTVQRGQAFARVAALAAPREPSLHFEVRQGAESVDPADFI